MQVGDGPQHREIGFPIFTDNASWRGPNIENFEKKFYRQCKLGWGPNTEELDFQFLRTMQVGVGPQHRSCRKVSLQQCASWRGPNIKKYFFFRNQYFLCMSLTHVILFLSTYYLWLMCKSHYII
ncbi:hypothetical protein FYM36_06245, partial [Staphylococcus aureus]